MSWHRGSGPAPTAWTLNRVLAPSGLGLLSGLLVDQVPSLQQALAEAGWQAELSARRDPWGLMTIRLASPTGSHVA